MSSVILITHEKTVDISTAVKQIEIYEDLFKNFMTAEVYVADPFNIPLNLKITGKETIIITLENEYALDEKNRKQTCVFALDSILERTNTNLSKTNMVLHGVSIEAISEQTIKISRKYDNLISDVVVDLFKKLKSNKLIEVETSTGKYSCIVPNLRIFDAINWLSKKSLSSYTNNPGYFFFETFPGKFNFRTLESLFIQKPSWFYEYSPQKITGDLSPFKLRSYSVQSSYDVLKQSANGTYGGTLLTVDSTLRKYRYFNENYRNWYGTSDHISRDNQYKANYKNEKGIYGLLPMVSESDNMSKESIRRPTSFLHTLEPKLTLDDIDKSVDDSGIDNDQPEKYHLRDNIIMGSIGIQSLAVEAEYNPLTSVGDIVDIHIASNENDPEPTGYDEYLSGLYMIASIRRTVQQSGCSLKMDLIKDSYTRKTLRK